MSTSPDLSSAKDIREPGNHLSNADDGERVRLSLIGRIRSMRWWKKIIVYFTLLLCGAYLISLIVINSSWFKSKIIKKLELKSGLEWEVGSVYWVPFGNIYINDTHSVSEDHHASGGIKIQSITVAPSWQRMFSGKLIWNDILLDGVIVDVEKQWLESRLKKTSEEAVPELKKDPKPKLPHSLAHKAPPSPKKNPPVQLKPVKPSKPVVVEKKQPEIVVGIQRRFRLKNCQVKLRNKDQVYLDIQDISMDIPFSGEQQTGQLSFSDANGELVMLPVEWDKLQIKVADRSLEWNGVKFKVVALARPTGSSVPFLFDLTIDDQPIVHHIDEPNLKVSIKASHIHGKFILRGNILSPQTWNGIGGLAMDRFSISETQKTHKALQFDRVYARARVLQGNLLVEDAQAQSEEISFMANGVVAKNGYSFGVLRCVANEEYCNKLDAIYHGSKAIKLKYKPYSFFQNLGTPDRKYFDMRFDGRLFELKLKHDRSDQWDSLKEVLLRLKSFKNQELKEDGLFLPES